VWEKVKRLGRNQRTILKVLAPCGGPPQPLEAVRWLAALEVHGSREALVIPDEGEAQEATEPRLASSFRDSFARSVDRLEERGLVRRATYPAAPEVTYLAPTEDGWAAIETLGLVPGR
jgi:hypothetical protein